MRNIIAVTLILISMASCKTKQAVVAEQAVTGSREATEIIEGHYKNKKDFKTLHVSASANYRDDKQSHSMSAEIRIKKDEIILISVRFLGITMAKAMITPQKVSYYEKINNTYFEGNYELLSRWLGTDLDFDKVQNIFLGEAMDDLTKGNYQAGVENGQYRLQAKQKGNISKLFLFEGANYLLKKQSVAQAGAQPRSLDIDYPAHKEYAKAILPAEIKIGAEQKDKVNIRVEYNSVNFDENLTYPYSVPEGFEQIFLD
jgi:hypothetical protein